MKKHKGRIVEISKRYGGFIRIIQGIKKDQQPSYDQQYWGSNGSYVISDESYSGIYAKVSVFDFDNKAIEIEIREIVINHYEWQRVSDKRVLELKNKLVGKKVTIIGNDKEYTIENIESML